MSQNVNSYDMRLNADWYDKSETYTDDVQLIRLLIGDIGPLRILEPFCGTGRILIPLAQDGHEIVGIDQSKTMLDLAHTKIARLADESRSRITLTQADVTSDEWPIGFDLVILGGNCFYELATPEEQEGCIVSAAAALKAGGYLYLDNNHMEGELDESWRQDKDTIWFDAPKRLVKFRRRIVETLPDGTTVENEYIQQKHPVSVAEQQEWLAAHGFVVEHLYGDRKGNPYTDSCGRGIFWARKKA